MSTEKQFNTPENQAIARKMLVAYLNTSGNQDNPTWNPLGKRVEDSSAEYDWGVETKKDIHDETYVTMKSPTITQSFDPWDLVNGDRAQEFIWKNAIRDQNVQALTHADMLIVHLYADTANTAAFAERYSACAIEVTGLGGAGGGNIGMPTTVTYGGTRTVGTASLNSGTVTFSPET